MKNIIHKLTLETDNLIPVMYILVVQFNDLTKAFCPFNKKKR